MQFLDQYSRPAAMRALASALQGQPITVSDYNRIVTYLAGARDYLQEPRRFQRQGTGEMSWPVVQGRGLLGEQRLMPIVGFTEPLPVVVSQGDTAYTSLAFRSSAISDAIGYLLRQLRSQTVILAGPSAASGAVEVPPEGPVAVAGEAAAAFLDADPGARVRIDPRMAQSIQTITQGAATLSHRISSWIRTGRLEAPTREENASVEAALWMADMYRSEARRTGAIAGVMLLGVGVAALGLGGFFDRFRKDKGKGDQKDAPQSQTRTILASQPQHLVPGTIFGTPASGLGQGLGVLG